MTDTVLADTLNNTFTAGFSFVCVCVLFLNPLALFTLSVIFNCNAYLDGRHSGVEMCQVHYTYYVI